MSGHLKTLRIGLILVAGLLAGTGSVAAGEHEGGVRKIDIAAVAASGEVDDGLAVATAGQPDEAALEALSESGFTTVIDLRGPAEQRGLDEQRVVEGLGMSYVALPVTGRDDLSFEKARELDAILAGADGPVLLHCGSGNRAGALIALRASLAGASDEEALEIGRESGLTGFEGLVLERLEGAED